MATRPLLSICIPTYNRSVWLEQSLKAAWSEVELSGGFAELVVSDNASPDNSRSVIESYENRPGFRAVIQSENIGPVLNMHNLVTQYAVGEYIWVIGDDDIIVPGTMAKILGNLRNNPGVNYFFVNYFKWMPDHLGDSPALSDLDQVERYGSRSVENYRVEQLSDLVGIDANCFTPIYCSVVNRQAAAGMFSRGIGQDRLSLNFLYPQALFVAEELMQQPAFHIGTPCVFASELISWSDIAPLIELKHHPDLLDIFELNGAKKERVDILRNSVVAASPPYAARLLASKPRKFSNVLIVVKFYRRFGYLPSYRAAVKSAVGLFLKHILPPSVVAVLRRLSPSPRSASEANGKS